MEIQTRAGVSALTDGEMRRYAYLGHFIDSIEGFDRLALSPQCGFASTEEGNLITAADQEAKLALVGETAGGVWGGS